MYPYIQTIMYFSRIEISKENNREKVEVMPPSYIQNNFPVLVGHTYSNAKNRSSNARMVGLLKTMTGIVIFIPKTERFSKRRNWFRRTFRLVVISPTIRSVSFT